MLGAFRVLAKLRRLRGTAFDIFGRTAERRMERQLVAEYEAVLDEIAKGLTSQNHAVAVELAALPMEIRGFGHVKESNRERAKAKEADLLARFRAPPPRAMAAE
jgi:indolepyruvate ferredoxin oxidoreductase